MHRIICLGFAAALLGVCAASAAPETDLERQAAMALRFEPFEGAGGPDWAPAFPSPMVRMVGAGKPDAAPLSLKAGSYMIVVLCNCGSMEVTLVGPNRKEIAPLRKGDQAAMFSLDVDADSDWLAGVDMGDCDEKACDFAVKVWRKKT
jgi:hypothetical protein